MPRLTKIQFRRDTESNWTTADPTLAEGELGYETDTGKAKMGDGSTAWTSLDYITNWGSGGGGGGGGGFSQEEIEDFVGAMFTGNTETLITATYQDADGTIDLVVDNDLSNYDNSTSGFITDYTVTQGDVTAHQAALSITESQISDFGTYLTSISSGDVTGALGYTPQNAATAFDGDYNSLTNQPTIPTNNNQLTNGAGFITGYTVTEGDVTAHEAALTITESQISDLGSYQPLATVLTNTTASFTTAQETKLSGIETGADVTDEANVTAALNGATLADVGTPASTDRVLLQDASDSNNLKYADFSEFGGGGGSGDVTGPASSTDNAVPRFDGTGGKTLQASSFLVDDSGYAQIGATPVFAQTRAFKIYDNGVNGAARMSMIGTSSNSLPPSIEFVLDGNTSRRALVRMEPVDTSNIGIRFYTTNAGTVTNTMDLLPDGELQIDGDLTVGGTVDGRDVATDGTKLDGIESGATADQSDAEIETAYNNQVDVVSQAEAEAGTATTVRRWTAQRVAQAIAALGGGGGGIGNVGQSFSAYNNSAQTTSSTSFVDTTSWTQDHADSVFSFNATTGVLTVNHTGTIMLGANITMEQTTGNNRAQPRMRIVEGTTQIEGLRAEGYTRQTGVGDRQALSVNKPLTVTSGDTFKVQISVDNALYTHRVVSGCAAFYAHVLA
jgi:hypothetical protein